MLIKICAFVPVVVVSCIVVGCAGPEQKLGRGLTNLGELARGGEITRSFEQTAIFGSPDQSYTTGLIHGVDRAMVRTGAGLYEVLTFPIPNRAPNDYGPILRPTDPVYPESYKPNWLADSITSPDTNLGFAGGDVAPIIPGSRFHIFDN